MKEIYDIPKEKYGLIGPRLHFIYTVKIQFISHHIRHKKIYMKNEIKANYKQDYKYEI